MKKRTLSKLGLLALTFVMLFTNVSAAFASDNSSATSQAVFELLEGDGDEITPPVDPEDPDYIIDPDPDGSGGNGSTGNTGNLRIDYVSNFSFGSQKIKSGAQKFYAALISADAEHAPNNRIKVPNFAQVTDTRGSGDGWTLYVKQDEQFKVRNGAYAGKTMNGARLSLNDIRTNTVSINDEIQVPNEQIVFDSMDAAKEVLIADSDSGYGTHVAHFGQYKQGQENTALTAVELYIPAGTAKYEATYSTTLTWTLSTVPGNEEEEEEDDEHEDGEEEEEIKEDIDDTDEGQEIVIDDSKWIILNKNEQTRTAELLYKGDIGERQYDSRGAKDWKDSELRQWLRTDYRQSLGAMSNLIVPVAKETALLGQSHSTPLETNMETVYLLSFKEYMTYSDRFLIHADSDYSLSYILRGAFSGGNSSPTSFYSSDTLSSVIIWYDLLSELGTYPDYPAKVRPAVTVRY